MKSLTMTLYLRPNPNGTRQSVESRWKSLGAACVAIVLLLWAGGCASKKATEGTPRPKNGIEEYRQIATVADLAIRRALDCLTSIAAQSNQCPPALLTNLSAEVNRLQVESVQVRARSQAMQARGEAYFERWHENMAKVSDPERHALAEAHRPQLQEGFRQIKALSQEGREAFDPFLADLRQLRNALEKDPACIDAVTTRDRIREATEYGQHAERCVAGIGRELDAMSALLVPARKSVQN